ncbi:MAG: cardiolipin synthase, partial [Bacteroides sp.]|nr:cardiolipin synthase [Bacteroides sp.]
MNYLKEMEAPVTRNNEVKLLMSGREKFTDLFESIRHARHHIHLEYFNFR